MALDFQRPDPSSPAAVAAAQFTITRRGYREEEVRDFLRQVSVELARLLERERFLESELKAMQARGPVDTTSIDEAAVTELLGAEAARVLTSAREAAQAMRDRAAESAEHIIRDASREAARLLEESTLEASRKRSDVSTEAEQELEVAKQQGREIIAEVRAYRERVLTDLTKRTDEARRELERIVIERERLLGAFERARHVASDVVGDLNDFDQSLKETGVTPPLVPPDAPPPPRPTRNTDTPIFDAKQYVHELGGANQDTVADESNDSPTLSDSAPESVRTEPSVTDAPTTEHNANDSLGDESSVRESASIDDKEMVVQHSESVESTPAPVTTAQPEHIAEVVNIFDRQRRREAPEPAPKGSVPEHPVFERVEARPEEETVQASNSRVDEIFARLRTSSTERVAKETTKDLVAPTKSASKGARGRKPRTGSTIDPTQRVTPPVVNDGVFRRRDEVVVPALEAMSRGMKRRLADDENTALTHVRGKRSTLTVAAMFSTPVEHAQHYTAAVSDLVMGIAADAARSLTDSRRVDVRGIVANGAVTGAVTDWFTSSFVRPLHERVNDAISAAAGDRDILATSLRAVFHEWKVQRVASIAADIAHVAYARGLFLGCDTKSSVCWAVDPAGPPCSDAEDNSLAGSTRHGEHFPTGHAHPLAHAGCRCLVVPLDK